MPVYYTYIYKYFFPGSHASPIIQGSRESRATPIRWDIVLERFMSFTWVLWRAGRIKGDSTCGSARVDRSLGCLALSLLLFSSRHHHTVYIVYVCICSEYSAPRADLFFSLVFFSWGSTRAVCLRLLCAARILIAFLSLREAGRWITNDFFW